MHEINERDILEGVSLGRDFPTQEEEHPEDAGIVKPMSTVVRIVPAQICGFKPQPVPPKEKRLCAGPCGKQFVPIKPEFNLCPACHKKEVARQAASRQEKYEAERRRRLEAAEQRHVVATLECRLKQDVVEYLVVLAEFGGAAPEDATPPMNFGYEGGDLLATRGDIKVKIENIEAVVFRACKDMEEQFAARRAAEHAEAELRRSKNRRVQSHQLAMKEAFSKSLLPFGPSALSALVEVRVKEGSDKVMLVERVPELGTVTVEFTDQRLTSAVRAQEDERRRLKKLAERERLMAPMAAPAANPVHVAVDKDVLAKHAMKPKLKEDKGGGGKNQKKGKQRK